MKLYDRKNPRASRHDYHSERMYFVTICTKNREHYFGEIKNKEMILNKIGEICNKEIEKLTNRKSIIIHEYVVMPNHVHILLEICKDASLMRPNRCIEKDGSSNRPNKNKTLYSEKQ
jgi:REP element-mobilizing transposase RayT